MTGKRQFLFLQGPSSPIFGRIADHLERLGHGCHRINICPGDQVFWRRAGAVNYRGRRQDWGAFIDGFLSDKAVTDIVLLGEERPYHKIALDRVRARGLDVYVVEMGYLRPDWITLERGGMSTNSHFPNDPDLIVAAAASLDEPDYRRRYSHRFASEAACDLAYNLPNVFLGFLFPHYRRHALYHPLLEYAGWLRRLATGGGRKRQAAERIGDLLRSPRPFFLFPLQLQTDFQIRAHSPFADQQQAIDHVLASFAEHAGPETRLAVKVHPLDTGIVDWEAYLAEKAATLGLGGRVVYLPGGDLETLIDRAEGVVTINSTVGIEALRRGRPTKVLGTALFDIDRLTDRGAFDTFWTRPRGPDGAVRDAFFRLLAAAIHVRGNFYSASGAEAGASAIAERLHRRTVNEPGAYVAVPPRKKLETICES